jgi:1-acyl-sn-glycerol-3-phosphate acyltransferase
LVEKVGGSITVENVAAVAGLSGPALFVGNHMSTLETFMLPCMIVPYRPVTFVVKRELVDMPVFKHVMRSRNPVVVGRDNPRDDLRVMLEEGEARLRAGVSVIVFPQRTRAPVWKPGEFNSIAVKLAKRAGVPVVPLAVRTDLWGTGRLIKDFGPIRPERAVRFSFGDPLAVTGNGRDAQAAVVAFITAKMQSWGVPIIETSAPLPAGE